MNFNNPSSITYTNLTGNLNAYDPDVLNKAFINDIEIDDLNANKVWLAFGNLEKGKKVYYSSDGGITWENISSNLPNIPTNTLQYDSVNNTLYVGNDYGVYYYNNTSKLWARYGVDLPVAIVTTIAIDNVANEIIASTHGRSVWTAPLMSTPCGNTIVTTFETWSTDRDIYGDLIIKSGGSVLLSNARIKANNIIIETGGALTTSNGELTSNHNNTSSTNLNTDIMVESNANLSLTNSTVNNFTINVKDGAVITLKIKGVFPGYVNLNHSKINVMNNATYNQTANVTVALNDLESTINFFDNFLFGYFIYVNKVDAVAFSGLGSLNIINSSTIYVQNESLTNGNKYRFDSDTSISTGNSVNPDPLSLTGDFDTNNANVILKAKQSITLDPGTIIETDSFIAFIDSDDLSNYNKNVITDIDNTKDGILEIKSVNAKVVESITVFLNPTRDYLNIQLKDDTLKNVEIVIRDVNGHIMHRSVMTETSKRVDLTRYKKGIYFLDFVKNKRILFKRIIKF
ncbi:MAG: T9SS type A sorting domain-containing protein [Flavobacteriaceae bacterium]|nr:T9SS type A sorting domain-containing protein [Flavobacteriaceae bacterium]